MGGGGLKKTGGGGGGAFLYKMGGGRKGFGPAERPKTVLRGAQKVSYPPFSYFVAPPSL